MALIHPATAPADQLLDAVEALQLLVQRDPEQAERASRQLLAGLPRRARPDVRARATWTLGRALMETGDLDGSIVALRRAAAIARRHGDGRIHAAVQTTLGAVLAEAGRSGAALHTLRRAEAGTAPADLGRLYAQRVLVHAHRGELTAAVASADRGLALLREHGDDLGSLRLLVNRSIVWLNAGRPDDAERDLVAARPLAVALDQDLILAGIEHNLGVAARRRGEIPSSLRQFEVAADAYERLGSPARVVAFLEVDRAEVLLHAGLYEEAAASAASAARLAAASGQVISAAESQLLGARALAAAGSPAAPAAARAAVSAFRRAGRRPWVVLAQAVEWEADADHRSAARRIAGGRGLAAALDEAGWSTDGSRVSALVAAAALEAGTPEESIPELRDAARRRRTGPAWLRARWWYVEALRRDRHGNARGVLAAVEAGLRAIDEHRATFGSIELRVGASSFGAPLARLAIDVVTPAGDGRAVLRWAERWRASSLRGRVTAPPRGAAAEALTILRTRQATIAQLAPDDPSYRTAAVALARAELDVRRQSRAAGAPGRAAATSLAGLDDAVGRGVLLAFHEHRGRVHAVVVREGRWTVCDVADSEVVTTECDHLFAIAQRAMVDQRAAGRVHDAAACAEEVLLHGLELGDGPAVVVPAGPLHRVPWGVLPSLSNRPVTLAPSVATWLRLQRRRPPRPTRPLLVAGPTLPGADAEVHTLAHLLPDATVLAGSASAVDAVIAAVADADVLHVAAHGTFRHDNPMLSTLQLADGALTVYDLEQLRRVPRVVVLSACSAGRVATASGAEVLGTVAVLLDRGVTNVVAPVTVVADLPAVAVVEAVYRAWASGAAPAAALAAARRSALARGDDRDWVVAGVLTCFGR